MSLFGKPQTTGASPFSNANPFQASANQNKPSPFALGLTTTPQNNPSSGLFGGQGSSGQTQAATGGLFGGGTPQQGSNTGSLFGGSTLVGSDTSQQPKPSSSSLFGGSTNLFGGNQQQSQQETKNTLGGSMIQQQPQQQQGGGIFGGTIQNLQQPPQPGPNNPFGGSLSQQQPQQQQGGSIFGGSNQNAQQQQQGQQQSTMIQSRMFQQPDVLTRPRTVTEQIEVAFSKWNPQSPNSAFQTYLYNSVPPEKAPFFSPGPQDDEAKWEEALRKKPSPGAVPVMVRGFEQLALRMGKQYQHLLILQGRLHEINDGLEMLLRKHDLEISTRAAECRRKHLKLSHQCLRLAASVQVLRNRGYAMDSSEEELRKRLLTLEKSVFDPALNGRGEEIWARMVSVRERGRQLQREYERAGKNLADGATREIDEEVLKRATKILEDYSQQLSHLVKELSQIQKDFAEWEAGKSGVGINGSAR